MAGPPNVAGPGKTSPLSPLDGPEHSTVRLHFHINNFLMVYVLSVVAMKGFVNATDYIIVYAVSFMPCINGDVQTLPINASCKVSVNLIRVAKFF